MASSGKGTKWMYLYPASALSAVTVTTLIKHAQFREEGSKLGMDE